jgi:hypothetical protein|tara:strand:+ start:210 stop:650 length:441 start_codon:yes stop_codon:yes gene_type:complete
MEDSKKSGIAKLKKLGLTDEEINSMLNIEEELPPEEELAAAEEQNELNSKAWKQDFLIEQLGYYNEIHNTSYELKEWVLGIQSEDIVVHFDWKELAGIRKNPLNDPDSPEYKKQAAEMLAIRNQAAKERAENGGVHPKRNGWKQEL